tara:strand:+ start:190 stop:552 length:363 start_codon:yes stop_codon:yes gene_type:complete
MTIEFLDAEKLTYNEFVEKYKAGEIVLAVDTDAAGYAFTNILSEYAVKQATYRTFFFGGFIAGLIAIFFVGWWSLIGFAAGFIGMRASRSHTNRSVIKESLKNPAAYEEFTKANILAART